MIASTKRAITESRKNLLFNIFSHLITGEILTVDGGHSWKG
jgi:hypothetical protein